MNTIQGATMDMESDHDITEDVALSFTQAAQPLKRAPAIWKSRISWRITAAVFLTIMMVQASILALTLKSHRDEKLSEVAEASRTAILPLLDRVSDDLWAPPFTAEQERRLIDNTPIDGIAIYSRDFNLLRISGEQVLTQVRQDKDFTKQYLNDDHTRFERVFRPRELNGRPYIMVVRMDALTAMDDVAFYVRQNILIMLLLSAFVTTVLMIALGKWLLEPILFLRSNLEAASSNPEIPHIARSPYDPRDEIGGAISIAQDLIKQNAKSLRQIKNAAQSQIHKLAYYDTLTSLPNRTLFLQKLSDQAKLFSTDQNKSIRQIAIFTMDLDHFKDINDSMGHNVGDSILRSVAKRLRAALPEQAVIARSGEDEFSIMYPIEADTITPRIAGETIRDIIRAEPFKVFNESFQIRSSIGVSVFPDDATDPDQVVKNSDIALNRAKEDGRDCLREYLEDFDKAVQARFQILRDLRDALEKDKLSLHYQPQLDLTTGSVIGAEALIRWFKEDDSKEGGKFISPGEFIPIAEQSGLIVPIGNWVLRKACETAKTWHEAGHMIRVAVNVSGAQFQQSDLVAYTQKVITETGIDPHLLELEVTESAFMNDIQQTVQTLKELNALGIELAIDDFGTGYSSLSYLRQFPIDRLKIDQSFIRNALTNSDDMAIARTIVGLGRSLNLKVIAEGVETLEHETFLRAEGCDEVQGFRYSRPLPVERFVDFINTYSGSLAYFDKKAG